MTSPFIAFDNVSFRYQKDLVIEKVSFQICEREFIAIIGPNGGGKTTLLKLIMGLYLPMQGKVTIEDKPPYAFRQKIGYVPQVASFDSDFPLTTLELVLMGCTSLLTPFGRYPKKAYDLAGAALDKVGLLNCKEMPFGSLSGGQARRALIARAIVNSPTLLLLDEPTANIDAAAEESVGKLISSLKKEMTLLMVTHDLPGILTEVDRVFCMQKHCTELTPSSICSHYPLGVYHTFPKGDNKNG